MTNDKIKGLYAIADGKFNPYPSLHELVEKFLMGGCQIVQMRMKGEAHESCLASAKLIIKLKKKYDFLFIVNDHADIAFEIGADGVHVGENDAPVAEIKKKYGPKLMVGYSSHSIDEAKRAVADGADYVAFGAIFPTKTKGPGHPVQGLQKLRELIRAIDAPVVAIGGIGRANFEEVLSAGASSIAMITALAEADDIVGEVRWFNERVCPHNCRL